VWLYQNGVQSQLKMSLTTKHIPLLNLNQGQSLTEVVVVNPVRNFTKLGDLSPRATHMLKAYKQKNNKKAHRKSHSKYSWCKDCLSKACFWIAFFVIL